jgi:1-aminocyclopropane-1-carboxylate deaminase
MNMVIDASNILVSDITEPWMQGYDVSLHLLRMDAVHPQISGNKYFKLLPYLQQFKKGNYTSIISFGGPFSNYIHALAYWCYTNKIACKLYIRGNEVHNHTLQDCIKWGATLEFLDRTIFDNLIKNTDALIADETALVIPFGAQDSNGLYGVSEIVAQHQLNKYTHLASSIGTGTTFLGLCNNTISSTTKLGFMATKDKTLQAQLQTEDAIIYNQYTFGGFAKTDDTLIEFILKFYSTHNIILDIVYTSKMLFGLHHLINRNIIPRGSKIMALHTGGLQGNRSHKNLKHLTLV